MERAPEARAPALPLVGRSAEIARIGMAMERAAGRHGSMLLLAGPAGIGKSRLVREALTVAEERGFVTLSGSARALGQSLAYAPVLEALGPYLMALPPGRRVGLLDGLPDLGRLFIGLHLPPPAPLGDPALERTRLFEAVDRLLGRLAEQAPVALALDDLHWADTATVELLHYLARGVGYRRMLLVGTYRADEAEVEPAVWALVRDVRRAGLAEELPLAGLTAGGVQSLARAMLGGDPPPALVSLLTERAAGSQLVVTALIGELLAGGGLFRSGGAWALGPGALDTVPGAVRDLVLGYLQRLTTQERGLLELVAVAGDAATPPVLAEVLGADEERVLARLRRLRDLGLVTEVTEGWGIREPGPIPGGAPTHRDVVHRAAHPAYAEVAYAELPEATRRRLHAAIVVALERRWPDDIDLLAPHYRGAGSLLDRRRALDVLVAAAERALAVHAGEEAARDLEAALRGGGGNFGVVTRFSFRLHQVGPTITGGLIAWSAERAADVLAAYHDLTESAPQELTAAAIIRLAPPAPFVPSQWHGKPIAGILLCHTGADPAVDLAPVRALGDPILDLAPQALCLPAVDAQRDGAQGTASLLEDRVPPWPVERVPRRLLWPRATDHLAPVAFAGVPPRRCHQRP